MEPQHDNNEIDKVDPITETTLENDAEEEIRARVAVSVNHRRLNPRQIQLTAIAGSIGAALFVAIGSGVLSGPLCLLIGMSLLCWSGRGYLLMKQHSCSGPL
jgi:amino acid transporter